VSFAQALRDAGVPATLEGSSRLVRAVQLVNPLTNTDLYWAARVTLVSDHTQLEVFDRIFGQVFGGLVDVADQRGDPTTPRTASRPTADRNRATTAGPLAGASAVSASAAAERDRPTDDNLDAALTARAASRDERLATTDFAHLDDGELAELQRLMRQLRLSPPIRPGRRRRRHHQGDQLDLRATLRRTRHTGGDPVHHIRRRRRPRPRRLVVLCDISGSMEPYARAYVQLLHATAGTIRAEVFTFATRLTRLTGALAVNQPQLAMWRAAHAAPDWRGGTRIGEALKSFLDNYGRRGMARGAVVVIVSDGWERDDPSLIAEQMGRLRRLAHRIIWVNPRTADPRYQPLAAGIAAALPYCDDMVSGHTLAALGELADVIAGRS
jgi:uncharacterized protein with von Willebrand factor type A (vWA) domain